jgi:8-oxo-dGTP pyrophosphatase MutT (NUDIX family)
MADQVKAAGGVLWRRSDDGTLEIAVVHRPRYDDWSLPKGKLDDGESFEEAAVREVEEETGMRCRLGRELGETHYEDRKGRPKIVRYWAMGECAGEFEPNDEVDDLRWVPIGDAKDVLTYDFDRELVDRVAAEAQG